MNSENINHSKEYFPALTGVRALAALLVYFHHFNPVPKEYSVIHGFFNEFYTGVTFFFVLSGLLITLRYSDEKINFRNYLVNRAARIYPMWFILTIVTFLFTFSFTFDWFGLLFSNLTFLKGFSDKLKFTGIDQGWSLTVEECFYFLAPLLILLISKRRSMVFFLTLAFIAVGALLHMFFTAINVPAFENFNFIFLYTIFGRAWEFLIGVLAALLYKAHKEKIKNFYKNFAGINTLLILYMGIIIFLMYHYRDPGKYGNFSASGKILNNFVLPVFIVLFYIGLIVKKDFWNKIFSTKALIFGGKISYVFYLIHMGIFHFYTAQFLDGLNIMRFRKVIEFVILVLISAVMYYYMEEPLNKKAKKFFKGNKPK